MYDVIRSRLSACVLYWPVLEAAAGPWRGALWFGCPYGCLADTTGVDISHGDYGRGLWWSLHKTEREREACLGPHIQKM